MSAAQSGGSVFLEDPDVTIWNGDALSVLRELPDESVDCCVTSPPYWGLRDYGTAEWQGGDAECDHHPTSPAVLEMNLRLSQVACSRCGATRIDWQVGLESTPAEYIEALVAVFREVRRVLADTGTLWLNLGDSYNSNPSWGRGRSTLEGRPQSEIPRNNHSKVARSGFKPKDLLMLPARVAIALQDDGWWLRSEIVWAKLNPMPESVTDRPTAATERVFLLAKSQRYYYDGASVKEGAAWERWGKQNPGEWAKAVPSKAGIVQPRTKAEIHLRWQGEGRNMRNCWPLATESYEGAHFATYPQELVRRCILPGCPEGGTVLDPFGGSGTTALVARNHGRKSILIELNPDYCALAAGRLAQQSLLAESPCSVCRSYGHFTHNHPEGYENPMYEALA